MVGVREVDAAAQEVACQGVIVLAGVVAEKREAESALALEGAVAGAGVTAHATEQAHDMALEVDIAEGCSSGQSNRRWCSRRRKSSEDGQGKKDKPQPRKSGSEHSLVLSRAVHGSRPSRLRRTRAKPKAILSPC